MKIVDLSGKKFEKWTVIERAINNTGETRWLCKCDCGKIKEVNSYTLRHGISKSCGCNRPITYVDESTRCHIYAKYRYRSLKRELEFTISQEYFIQITKLDCYYCGDKPSNLNKPRRGGESFYYNGIDRIDSDKGYTEDNTVPCCKTCNFAKRDVTQEQFIDMIKKIYERHCK